MSETRRERQKRGYASDTISVSHQMLMRGSQVPLFVVANAKAVHRISAPFASDGEKPAALALGPLWGTAHNATTITTIAEGGMQWAPLPQACMRTRRSRVMTGRRLRWLPTASSERTSGRSAAP